MAVAAVTLVVLGLIVSGTVIVLAGMASKAALRILGTR
jgi:uncharacterized membrane protein